MSYLKSLNNEIREMWELVISQHEKALEAMVHFDKDLAREIILIEERVNSCEQFIENDCENYISSRKNQQGDIHFIMFVLKLTRQLEIIGDLAKKIANDIINTHSSYGKQLLGKVKAEDLFKRSNNILELTMEAFEESDTSLASLILNRVKAFFDISSGTNQTIADYVSETPDEMDESLNLLSVIESLKRVVDLSRNMAEGIISVEQSAKQKI